MSFSIGEQEAKSMGPSLVAGSYAGWNYFQTVESPENAKFIAAYKAKFGADAVVTDPMVHGYVDVYLWKAAVEKAMSFDPGKVRAAAVALDSIPTRPGFGQVRRQQQPGPDRLCRQGRRHRPVQDPVDLEGSDPARSLRSGRLPGQELRHRLAFGQRKRARRGVGTCTIRPSWRDRFSTA
ncbi:MAG: transporter substrate-binding protein [Caulobacteraceae bacterium]